MMSGFTVSNRTVYEKINPLGHGQIFIQVKNSKPTISNFYNFSPWLEPNQSNQDNLKRQLIDITMQSIERVLERASSRQIAVPLSAGRDSRLIASALKDLGAKNVICYSYGPAGNFEAEIAKKISGMLGFDWAFVEVTPKIQKNSGKPRCPKNLQIGQMIFWRHRFFTIFS